MFLELAQYIFVVCFFSGMGVCISVVSFIFVQLVLTPVIRLAFPSFGVYENPDFALQDKAKPEAREIHLTALDYIMQEKIRRAREMKQQIFEITNPRQIANPVPAKRFVSDDPESFTIAPHQIALAVAHGISQPPTPESLWGIARFPGGSKTPHYLCFKTATKSQGLRTAWAPLVDRACKMDFASAARWLPVLGEGVSILPLNAAAREEQRRNLNVIAEKIRNDREVGREATQ